MNKTHRLTVGLAGLVAAALAGGAVAAPAQAAPAKAPGNMSLAAVLGADSGYDRNWGDFDIVEKAIMTVLAEKPESPVALLADGSKRATAFVPTDAAFRALVKDLTGKAPRTEKATFSAVASVADVDTLETILLYHVVAGKTLASPKVVASDGKSVKTAGGETVKVMVKGKKVILADKDTNDRDARVIAVDVNKGNKQIAHAIDRVLRPIDL